MNSAIRLPGFKLLAAAVMWLPLSAHSAINVVATTTSMEMLAREVGGTAVTITTLAAPDRDAHFLQAKPTMIRALRDARLVVAVGAELEQGWLPLAINSSSNPAILPGKDGYFEAAAQVTLLDVQGAAGADRARGDAHPMGNPHLNLDPERMVRVAAALADRLARLDAANASQFHDRAKAFADLIARQMPVWRKKVVGDSGVVLYHKDGDYLMHALSVPVLGYVEPVPGIPPTASHLAGLAAQLRGKKGVIIHTPFQSNGGIQTLASTLGWKEVALPLDPPAGSAGAGYVAHIDRWVTTLLQY